MSLVVTDPVNSLPEEDLTSPASGIVRTPFYWTSRGESLFGWWHTNSHDHQTDHAVVIAAPLGYEQVHAHRSLRHLADALAAHGIPALRFDWHGTGDSAGLDEDPDRWTVWSANLRDAVELVKRQFGIRRVSVVGLRLGATLAATSLTSSDIEHLVLWTPVVNGKTYVREMTAIDRTSEIARQSQPGEPLDLEPSGFVLSEETAKTVAQVNLLQSPPVRCSTLIVSREDLAVADGKLYEAYLAEGIVTDHMTFAGYPEMMISPHKGEVPHRAIESMVGWLSERMAASSPGTTAKPVFTGAQEMIACYQPEGRKPTEKVALLRERTIRISTEPDLFGILSEPTLPISSERPTIVLLNAGSAYRVGPGRLNVHLARRLASEGFRCMRIDANGLGDSVATEGASENDSYAATILRDVDLTLQFLRAQQLGRRFVLMGLCSGAYHAFQSAVALTDPTLVESILINPLTYFWKDGMVITESTDRQVAVQQYYFESALNPGKWLKLLSGQSQIGLRGAAKIVMHKLGFLRRKPRHHDCGDLERPLHSHPVRDDLPADLDQIVQHDRHVSMFFAETDPGYGILMHKAARRAKRLRQSGRLHVGFVSNADHNFSRRSARNDLLAAVVNRLLQRYPA